MELIVQPVCTRMIDHKLEDISADCGHLVIIRQLHRFRAFEIKLENERKDMFINYDVSIVALDGSTRRFVL